jgi:GntP family gluconate:H+ symporter
LLVASELGIDLNMAICAGLIVGGFAAVAGFGFSIWLDKKVVPELVDWTQMPTSDTAVDDGAKSRSPSVFWGLLPILLPVVLLAIGTISKLPTIEQSDHALVNELRSIGEIVGNKNVALSISAAVAIGLLWWSQPQGRQATTDAVQRALATGGTVLLVTAAGGAFGHIIRQTNIAGEIVRCMPTEGSGVALLLVAFVITALVRVAQGSATVAMITAVSIVAPLVGALELPFHPVYVFLAIGCGSKPLPWMNDSGFWVIGRMSGLTPGETLKTFSLLLTFMGLVGLLVTLCGALCVPLIR